MQTRSFYVSAFYVFYVYNALMSKLVVTDKCSCHNREMCVIVSSFTSQCMCLTISVDLCRVMMATIRMRAVELAVCKQLASSAAQQRSSSKKLHCFLPLW